MADSHKPENRTEWEPVGWVHNKAINMKQDIIY